jgi:hypothetical protein
MSDKTTVIHVADLHGGRGKVKLPWDAVYIGREMPSFGLGRSAFANPFHIPIDGTREDVIWKYNQWIRNRPDLVQHARQLLKGKRLVCWCKPLACHGDVLVQLIEEENHVVPGNNDGRNRMSDGSGPL